MGAVGLKISRDTSRMDVGKLVNDWMSKSTNPKIQQAYKLKQSTTFPDSIYKPLKSALEANDNKKALEEAYALIDNEPDEKAKKKREALILKEFNPFSYPNKDKDQKDPQVEIKPFATHSKEMEQQFRASLDKAGKDAYRQAIQDQVDLYVKLYRALYGRPEYPEGTPEAYQR